MSNKTAALAAGEALGGIICWTVGSQLGVHIAAANGWALNTILLVSCLGLEIVGLTMFTAARCRHAKRMGFLEGKREAEGEFFRSFIAAANAASRPRQEKAPAEKAN